MESVEKESDRELVLRTNELIEKLITKANAFNRGTLILSLFDVLFGVLNMFYTTLSLTALLASCCSFTAISICGKLVQISKIKALQKSLKPLKYVSVAYLAYRIKEFLIKRGKLKMTKSTVLQKILTTILAIFGVGGVVVGFLPQFVDIATEITLYVSMASECIATASGIFLAGTHDKVKSAEEIEKEKKAQEEKAKKKEIAEAEALVKKYEEAKAKEEKYQKAKELIENANKQEK